MPKKKNDVQELVLEKPFSINSAVLSDQMCNYGYEIMTGAAKGDKIPNRKGASIVHEDLRLAFANLDVHLALIDDAFIKTGREITELDQLDPIDYEDFSVVGFRVSGNEENEGYIIIGEKSVTHGVIDLETPKITSGTGYPFFTELKECIENARLEVGLYMNGKCTPQAEQGKLDFNAENDEDFVNATV